MPNEDLLSRLKRARIVQVLVVYFGASWVVLQIAEVLQEALALPSWVLPVAILLLLIGMVVILSTAWVQSLASTTAAEEAGEVPSDWQIAPAEAIESLTRGRLPHLTWGRAILGGVVAISLLFGISGVYVILTGKDALIGPTPAGADVAAEGIAVVPFEVRGEDLEIWREGMMDLLSNNLDGVGGYRTIDSRTVMSRWNARVGGDGDADLRTSLQAAGATGARYALLGSVVGLGNSVRLVANLYDLDTGDEVAQGAAEGPVEDVLGLADDLAVETMRSLLLSTGSSAVDQIQAETITTRSLPALRDFLAGESHYRRGEFAEAVQSYERAVAEDSAFAIALVRLAESYGWLENASSDRIAEYSTKAMAHRDRLSPRYQFIIDAWDAFNRDDVSGVEDLRLAVQKYPDDPEAWFLLAETYLHLGGATYGTEEDVWQALDRAVSLDPDFAPYLIHYAEWHVIRGDTAGAREVLRRYRTLNTNVRGIRHLDLAIPLLHGTEDEAAAAAETLLASDPSVVDVLLGTFQGKVDQYDRLDLAREVARVLLPQSQDALLIYSASTQGALARGRHLVDSLAVGPVTRTLFAANSALLWEVPLVEVDPAAAEPDACGEIGSVAGLCSAFLGMVWIAEDEPASAGAVLARMDEDLAARRRAASSSDEPPPAAIESNQYYRDFLAAYLAWARTRDPGPARAFLRPLATRPNNEGHLVRMALGRVEAEAGRTAEAIRQYSSVMEGYQRALARRELARLHQAAGYTEDARAQYRGLLVLNRSGDQDLPPAVEARAAVEGTGP